MIETCLNVFEMYILLLAKVYDGTQEIEKTLKALERFKKFN